jgi:hypothetical protein
MGLLLGMGAIALLIVLLVYGRFPVHVHRVLRQTAQPKFIPFPLDHPSLPAEVAKEFRTVIAQLRPAGFEPVTGLALPGQMSGVRSIVLLLANRPAQDVTMANVIYAGAAEAASLLRKSYVEFVSHFRDAKRLNTNNSCDLDVFPPWPVRTALQFPEVTDAGRLYRLHQALIARCHLRSKVFRLDEEFQGDAAAAVAAWGVEVLVGQAVGSGYLYLSPSENVYRPTWKGAFLMSWKQMWPMKAIRRAAADRKARRLLAELEAKRVRPF